jgi:menaquinone-dependent protoporphyrinogen oxidase
VWLFSSGPVGDPRRALVRRMDADPVELAHLRSITGARAHRRFPGRLDPANLPAAQRLALRLVPGLAGDFRDWVAARAWADGIAAELGAAGRAAAG